MTPSFRSLRRTGPLSQAPARYQQDLRNPGVSCVGQEGAGEGAARHSQGEEGDRTKQPCIFSQHPLADGQFPPGSASRSLKGTSCWRAPPKLLPFQPDWGTPGAAGPLFPRRVKTPTQHKSHIKASSTCQIKKKTKPNWTRTQIKERRTPCEGPRPRRSLASRHDTFLCNSGTGALGPLWGAGVKKYRDYGLPVGSQAGQGRHNLSQFFYCFWVHI